MWNPRTTGGRPGGAGATRRWRSLSGALLIFGGLFIGVTPVGAAGDLAVVAGDSGLAGFLATPLVAGLLFALGILLIVGEFLTAQFTGLGLAGLGLLALLFWGQRLTGAADWWALVLVALGVALLAAEILALPGFGFVGLAGLAALFGGLFLAVSSNGGAAQTDPSRGLSAVGVALLGFVAGGAAILRFLPRLVARRGLVLQSTVDRLAPAFALTLAGEHEPSASLSYVGATGEAVSDLRPGGYALIDGRQVDVITRGELIPRGAPVQVVADEGYRRIVRRLAPDEHPPEL